MTSLSRFVLIALAWLPVTFVVWYVAAPVLLWPVRMLAVGVASAALGDLVRSVTADGATLTFLTSLKPGRTDTAGIVSVDVNMLLYAFGLPLFAALTLAAGGRRARTMLIGYVALIPFMTWGVLADFMKNIAITSSPLIASQAGFSALQREMIAFAYQFGSLILPAVAPAVAWVLTHRRFLEQLRASSR
ncbi:MAG: exosortase H-associated membrane protein [Betaproteobacteria bacterium]